MQNKSKREKKTAYEVKKERYYKTYGVNLDDELQRIQEGCEVCGRKDGRLCLDHIHTAGFKTLPPEEKKKYVRGWACFLCNTGFRVFERTKDGKKNRERLEGTVRYFSKYKLKGE